MSKLYDVIGTFAYDQILANADADPIAVNLLPGQGEMKRGTILYKNEGGFYLPAATAQISTSYDLVVLGETVNTGSTAAAVAEVAQAYRAGTFIEGRVKLASDADVTEAHKIVLRMMGIKFGQSVQKAGSFPNGPFAITYKANNGASPAEADVVDHAMGGSYTTYDNSDTGFTPPASKTFSKWNTKDDGSGTDYAADTACTLTGDLTLFAVWAS